MIRGLGVFSVCEFCLHMLPVLRILPFKIRWESENSTGLSLIGDWNFFSSVLTTILGYTEFWPVLFDYPIRTASDLLAIFISSDESMLSEELLLGPPLCMRE